jgi:hypothetical protein
MFEITFLTGSSETVDDSAMRGASGSAVVSSCQASGACGGSFWPRVEPTQAMITQPMAAH